MVLFIGLPILRSILGQKKGSGGAGPTSGGPQAPPRRPPATELERVGRELWRELLGGGGPRETPPGGGPRTPSRRPAGRPSRPASTPTRTGNDAAARLDAERRRRTEREAARRAAETVRTSVDDERDSAPRRAADQELGGLVHSVQTPPATRLQPGVVASPQLDPTTIDDEMLARWGESEPSEGAATPPLELLGARLDWRQAVLLSEVLSPPLALRGPSSAFPGPPASSPQ